MPTSFSLAIPTTVLGKAIISIILFGRKISDKGVFTSSEEKIYNKYSHFDADRRKKLRKLEIEFF